MTLQGVTDQLKSRETGYGRQPLYFQAGTFAARAAIPAPKRSDSLSSCSDPYASDCVRFTRSPSSG
jgi:hypothetical protein